MAARRGEVLRPKALVFRRTVFFVFFGAKSLKFSKTPLANPMDSSKNPDSLYASLRIYQIVRDEEAEGDRSSEKKKERTLRASAERTEPFRRGAGGGREGASSRLGRARRA